MAAKILIEPGTSHITHNTSHITLILFFIAYFLMSSAARAELAFNGQIGVSAGYDNNASLSSEQKDSAFISYRGKFDIRLFPKNPDSEAGIFAEGMYREYLSLENNYRLRAGSYLTWQMAGGRLTPGIFGDISAYRDNLSQADEKNGIMVGAKLDWIASARLTLGIHQTWSHQSYDNPTNIYAHRDNPVLMLRRAAQSPESPVPPLLILPVFPEVENNRDESLSSTNIRCVMYLSSDVKGEVSGEYVRSDFSVSQESYIEKGLGLALTWTPSREWEISPAAYWKRFDYDGDTDSIKRQDTERGIGLNISRFFKAFELSVRVDLTDNHSDFETETYQRTVMQCGIVWSF